MQRDNNLVAQGLCLTDPAQNEHLPEQGILGCYATWSESSSF